MLIGMSGWTFAPWRGKFYPKGVKQADELKYAASRLNSVEVNGTFYGPQQPTTFAKWHDQTPDDFVFAIKGPKFITHIRRLTNVEEPLARFFATGVLRLNRKLGPILWQLPPTLKFDATVLERFLSQLPHDTDAAADAAADVADGARADANRPLRHAIEVRHASFATPEFVEMLRRHTVAAVVADSGGQWPLIEDVTADFIYVRLHGVGESYKSGYTDAALDAWADKLRAWNQGLDVFAYFDVEEKEFSPTNAIALALAQRMRAPGA